MTNVPAKQYQPQKDNALARAGTTEVSVPVLETAAQAAAAQSKALVEAKFTIAQHRPRDLDRVRAALIRECERPSFAEVAIYRKPIGDSGVEGLSIRYVEAALQAMGNIDTTSRVTHDDPGKRVYDVSVTDLERNVSYGQDVTVHKVVERKSLRKGETAISSRTNSYGQTVYLRAATDEEIVNTQQALISKVIRTQGARLVPGWLQAECEEQIRKTLAVKDKADPDSQKHKLLDAFNAVGVTVDNIKAYLNRTGLEVLTPVELQELRAIYTAVKDGEASWSEVMDAKASTTPAEVPAAPPPPPTPAPTPPAQPAPPAPTPPAGPPPAAPKPEETLDHRRRKGVQAVKDLLAKLGPQPAAPAERPVAGDQPKPAPQSAQPAMPPAPPAPKAGRVLHTTDPDGNPVEIQLADDDEDELP